MPPSVQLAQEVGKLLARSKILQRPLPEQTGIYRIKIHELLTQAAYLRKVTCTFVPNSLSTMNVSEFVTNIQSRWGELGTWLLLAAGLFAGYVVHRIIFTLIERWGHRRSEQSMALLVKKYLYRSTLFVLLLISVTSFIAPALDLSFDDTIAHILTVAIITAVANLLVKVIGLFRELLIRRFDVTATNNLHARKIYTQFRVIERIVVFLIVVFAIAIALMTFPAIRQVGVSLLASAGIAGVIIGFAAQQSLSTVLAGIQIAIAQPIRIDDIVIVEGEWGRVEEITLTYVVVRTWDQRRLIVPIKYFIEKPFQNWTRSSTELIGTVFVYTDYNAPVEAMREEFNQLLQQNELWDKRVAALQVTNATDQSIEIRMIASAANSGNTFDLRCQIREQMITFLQKNYPDSLPRTRMELSPLTKLNEGRDSAESMDESYRRHAEATRSGG